jgi:hypothetical protein
LRADRVDGRCVLLLDTEARVFRTSRRTHERAAMNDRGGFVHHQFVSLWSSGSHSAPFARRYSTWLRALTWWGIQRRPRRLHRTT